MPKPYFSSLSWDAYDLLSREDELPRWFVSPATDPPPLPQQKTHKTQMELNIEGFDGNTYVVDVDVDDTAKDLRRKVATAVGFAEDSFDMRFGGNGEGEDINITALSAGDTVRLTQTMKQEAIAALRSLGETDLTWWPMRVRDPRVAQLLLQAEVVTVIPSRFLAKANIRILDLSAPLAITAIDDYFLSECSSLESINLSGLHNVTTIGRDFLSGCTSLRTFDFAGLGSVTSVGEYFLAGCATLTSIDCAGMGSVTSLDAGFLSNCTSLTSPSLTSIDFAGLSQALDIASYFVARR